MTIKRQISKKHGMRMFFEVFTSYSLNYSVLQFIAIILLLYTFVYCNTPPYTVTYPFGVYPSARINILYRR